MKKYEKEEHDGPVGTHDTSAHCEPKYNKTMTKLHQSITSWMAEATVPSGGGRSGGENS